MRITQGVSPGMVEKKVINPLSLWERDRVREPWQGVIHIEYAIS